jgi:predicted dithiol-disulfide oxidoreductase (DUF899 family)
MGWSFPWASSFGSDFTYDFHPANTEEEWHSGAVTYNYGKRGFRMPQVRLFSRGRSGGAAPPGPGRSREVPDRAR